MRLAVTGSIATDHLMSFDGRFSESLLAEQLKSLSVSFLASDLRVRYGGTGGNIAFALGTIGVPAVLVGSVGNDAQDYLAWLADHGVDVSGVTQSADLASARFTCTTDKDLNQIATFYPGAMTEAVAIELATVGDFDLVLIAPNDPGAMLRHTNECRARGIDFAADPSQQLAFLDGEAIKPLVEGATWLFTNAYEAELIRSKTGWSDADVLDVVGTRVTTHGADGVTIARRGEPDLHVDVVPATELKDPTGVGDAFRGGFLAALSWGLGLERCAQVGCLLATLVVATEAPQDWVLDKADALRRFTEAYGQAAADELAPHLG